MFRNCTT